MASQRGNWNVVPGPSSTRRALIDDVAVAPNGTIVVGATAQRRRGRSTARRTASRGCAERVATPTAALVDAAGALSDPAGSHLTVRGSTTFAGGTDAALVRLRNSRAHSFSWSTKEQGRRASAGAARGGGGGRGGWATATAAPGSGRRQPADDLTARWL
jgi:hypothetical protein